MSSSFTTADSGERNGCDAAQALGALSQVIHWMRMGMCLGECTEASAEDGPWLMMMVRWPSWW